MAKLDIGNLYYMSTSKTFLLRKVSILSWGILSLAKKFKKENYSCKVQMTNHEIVLTLKSKNSLAF